MVSLYAALIRPLLFKTDPEWAHHFAIECCQIVGSFPGFAKVMQRCFEFSHPSLELNIAGIHFPNPVGLAAGWDKNARALRLLDSLGFGFTEIGSVSARPSPGNPKPRLFRLPEEEAIIVNYGLPNDGAEVISKRLTQCQPRRPRGINVVSTNDGPTRAPLSVDAVFEDYLSSVRKLHTYAQYLMLNLSCPNACDGVNIFSEPGSISRLLTSMQSLNVTCPIFLKIPPSLDNAFHDRLLSECDSHPMVRGFCFNLPTGKPDSLNFKKTRGRWDSMPGAVAGKPVESLINQCISSLYHKLDPNKHIIIGAGGVFTAEDAYLKVRLGASLVQIYTAFIFAGPNAAMEICRGLVELMKRDGFTSLAQVVGTAHRQH